MTSEYDLIVVGAGAVGENVADRAVQGGLDVLIVESELVGGECSYWACMPSKALLRAGSVLRAAHRAPGAREAATGTLDADAVLAHRDDIAAHWDDSGQVRWLDKAGIELARGHARLDGERRVVITSDDGATRTVTARHAVALCTGSAATVPPIDGLEDARAWTSREVTSAKSIPKRLAIIGGGVVGCEMATAFQSLGSHVTLIARSGLLAGLEPFAGEAVAERLRAEGADVRTGISPTHVARNADGTVTITLDGDDTIEADEVVVATGRRAATDDLGLDTIGLTAGDWIEVDDTMRVTGHDWLYAVGDVTGRVLLTHQGKYQARAAGDVIAARAHGASVDTAAWGVHVATADHRAVPQVVFTSPEVASVGLTAAAAEKSGIATRVVDYSLGWVAAASVHGDDYEGTARLVIDTERQVVVGFTVVGDDVAELLHAATIAIVGEVPIDRLWHAVPSYPTLSEVWLRLLEALGRPSVTPPS
ncbi:dihydrolipoamide dehydrogenase [Microcella putealis]|uniref:Dihydrolipoamide dehydrogenase n=1 Tax=Microcella putealis TaxID=337005 RepID=A0A4Q7LVV4_9MICO|nr:NAD(P)/FAD-dependent oxidoreductase [Microcella putealis]RZS59195.1 dihydrolipoamide dehydrogenase [Microcella putealis]TQM24221.1 dihydrolipoamide dehydrogenase [Microcella putealis]